jgi:hypothetical protein
LPIAEVSPPVIEKTAPPVTQEPAYTPTPRTRRRPWRPSLRQPR